MQMRASYTYPTSGDIITRTVYKIHAVNLFCCNYLLLPFYTLSVRMFSKSLSNRVSLCSGNVLLFTFLYAVYVVVVVAVVYINDVVDVFVVEFLIQYNHNPRLEIQS